MVSFIRYLFEVTNEVGSVKGSVVLEVISSNERKALNQSIQQFSVINNCLETNPVEKNEFGEYVAGLHSSNNLIFTTQFKVHL